jgi:vancomycin resistance protein VanW
MKQRKLFSQWHPVCYFIAVGIRRWHRRLLWIFDSKQYAQQKAKTVLPHNVKRHQSTLLRKLGDVDMQLQINKVTNLSIAIKEIDGIIIAPGQTFSFCKLVGLPTKKKGYLLGMELSFGRPKPGIGGGICQLANMIHWLVLHSPLEVVERSQHSFDPFPDEGRVLPFGSGAAIFYNYIDYQFYNPTDQSFQLNLWLTEKTLEGALRSERALPNSYHIFERDHRFVKLGTDYYRRNEIWKRINDKRTGNVLAEICMVKNNARLSYVPNEWQEIEEDLA